MVARASGLVVRTPDSSVAGDPGFDSRLVHFRSTVFDGPGAALGASWGAPGGSWVLVVALGAPLGLPTAPSSVFFCVLSRWGSVPLGPHLARNHRLYVLCVF